MSVKFRISVECISENETATRKEIKEYKIDKPENILELGFRHTEQIEIIQKIQDELLAIQSKYLKDNVTHCPVCGNKLSKNGFEHSNFHSVFTDHKVKVQRLRCGKCQWMSTPSVQSLFGTALHPDHAKLQCEIGSNRSYREAQNTLNSISSTYRRINNHDRIKHIIESVGDVIPEYENNKQAKGNRQPQTNTLIVQIDGGHVKSVKSESERSFEVLTSVIYRPENVVKTENGNRGIITSKHCAASALDDNHKSINKATLNAAKKQGLCSTTEITAICDGADNCWSVVNSLAPHCLSILRILDWFHIAMRFKNIALPQEYKDKLIRIKWHLWRGNVDNAKVRFEQLIDIIPVKYKDKVIKLRNYIINNSDNIVNYRERMNDKKAFTSYMAESNVESLINQRCKGQKHMRWTRKGIQPLLQIRAYVASNDWSLNWEDVVLMGLANAA